MKRKRTLHPLELPEPLCKLSERIAGPHLSGPKPRTSMRQRTGDLAVENGIPKRKKGGLYEGSSEDFL